MALREDWFELEKLHRAAREGNLSQISSLVAEGFEIDAFDDLSRTPLHYAVEEGQLGAAQLLISLGSNVNRHDEEMIGETPLCLAVQGDSPEIVGLLMAHGAIADIPGWMGLTARVRAKKRSDENGKIIAAMLEAG
ncbi:MAG: ankyrin repeat domain-containing protein [Pseudomonadota bacterium]